MKSRSWPLHRLLWVPLLALALAGSADALAQGQSRTAAKGKKTKATVASTKKPKVEKVYITGSRIPRRVQADTGAPESDLSLAIISNAEIKSTGAGSLEQALKKNPTFR